MGIPFVVQPAWIEDLGGITTVRASEALILLVPHIPRRHGFQPFAVSLACRRHRPPTRRHLARFGPYDPLSGCGA